MYIVNFSGVIGEELTAQWMRKQLKVAAGGPVRMEINSPGGSIFAGREIRRAVLEYSGRVTARIIFAASMASDISTAANEVICFEDSVYMLHRASGLTLGSGPDHKKTGDQLEKLDRQLAQDYARRSGKSIQEILNLMDEETWLYGAEIKDSGFADRFIVEGETRKEKANAVIDAKRKFGASYRKPDRQEIAALFKDSKSGLVPLEALYGEKPKIKEPEKLPEMNQDLLAAAIQDQIYRSKIL